MADSIPLGALPTTSNTRRDQYGRYLVVPPGGGKPIGYTRVTTIAKVLDAGGGLGPWKAAMTAVGMLKRKGLHARWEALMSETGGDPWYHSPESKAETKALIEECATAGGADERRELGNALHAITAMVDQGQTPEHLSDETRRDIKAYRDGMADAGITLMPDRVELTVVLDNHSVAGTFDRLVCVPGFNLPLVADLKTGSNLEYSWCSIAVQLAAYARANSIYVQGASKDGSDDRRYPMPNVDQDFGLVMWLDAGSARLQLFLVDLNAGWEAFEASIWTRAWRKSEPVERFDGELITQLQKSLHKVAADFAETRSATLDQAKEAVDKAAGGAVALPSSWPAAPVEAIVTPQQAKDFLAVQETVDAHRELREWLQHRIDIIGSENKNNSREMLMRVWPQDVPALRSSDKHTPEQLGLIEHVLDEVERDCSCSFSLTLAQYVELQGFRRAQQAQEPTHGEAVSNVVSMFPGSTIESETPTNNQAKDPFPS